MAIAAATAPTATSSGEPDERDLDEVPVAAVEGARGQAASGVLPEAGIATEVELSLGAEPNQRDSCQARDGDRRRKNRRGQATGRDAALARASGHDPREDDHEEDGDEVVERCVVGEDREGRADDGRQRGPALGRSTNSNVASALSTTRASASP
jgi:hypothetical protein